MLWPSSPTKTVDKTSCNCCVFQCATRQYGNGSKVPWRVEEPPQDGGLFQATRAGRVVNQIKPTVPDLVRQIQGWLTAQRCHVATIGIDHDSRRSFIYLPKSEHIDETRTAKQASNWFACTMDAKGFQYHSAKHNRMKDEEEADQRRTIHSQAGVAEYLIRKLQDCESTSLDYGGPTVNTQIWPYSLRHCEDVMVRPNLTHFPLYGCPVCRVQNETPAGNNHQNWLCRATPEIYLIASSHQVQAVSPVLDLGTAQVSPQIPLRCNNLSEMVASGRVCLQTQVSTWQP
jgi:hypothetical protein